jgi:hypothetical protein
MGWVGSGGPNLAPGPLGSVAGDPDRHRDWLVCPSSVPAAAGRGLRPRVFSAHGPGPQLQLQVHAPACAVTAHPLAKRLQTGPAAFLLQAIFTNLARSCADSDWRSSANQGRGSPFRHTGCTTQ